MGKNLIPEIARMLGVEIGEEFEWHSKHDCITYRLKFKENEVLYCTRRIYKDLEGKEKIERHWIDGKVVSEFLKEVLGGHDKIIKLPWKPKKGDVYFTFGLLGDKWVVRSLWWGGFPEEYALLDKGWVYRTEGEAQAALPKVAAEIGAEYELPTSDTEAVEPWKPKEGEFYYSFGIFAQTWGVSKICWLQHPFDFALLAKGWVYRTKKEAKAALPTVAKEMGVKYEL